MPNVMMIFGTDEEKTRKSADTWRGIRLHKNAGVSSKGKMHARSNLIRIYAEIDRQIHPVVKARIPQLYWKRAYAEGKSSSVFAATFSSRLPI